MTGLIFVLCQRENLFKLVDANQKVGIGSHQAGDAGQPIFIALELLVKISRSILGSLAQGDFRVRPKGRGPGNRSMI